MKAVRLMFVAFTAFMLNPIWSVFRRFIVGPSGESELLDSFISNSEPWQVWVFFISVIVIAPLIEELIFRVALWWFLKKIASDIFVGIVVAILFSVAHGESAFWLLPLSFALSYARSKYNIWYCISIHVGWNAGALVLPWLLIKHYT